MIKALLLDGDGVVIAPHPYFSQVLKERYGIGSKLLLPFFKGVFKECTVGKADLKEELGKVIADWGFEGSVEELLDLWFKSEHKLDEEVLKIAHHLRSNGMKVYLASDNEKYRAAYVMKEMGIGEKVDGAFFSADLGHSKAAPEFFAKVVRELGLEPGEIAYFDDDPENVKVAKGAGIQAHVFENAGTMATLIGSAS